MKRIAKSVLIAALCAFLCFSMIPLTASAEGGAAVSVSDASGKAGDTVTINVSLDENPGVIAMNLNVNYDDKQLELVNVSDSGMLKGFYSSSSYEGSSYVLNWEDALSTENNKGTGTVATLTFKLKEDCDKASVTVAGNGYNADVDSVSVSGSSGTITNTNPTTTTTKPPTTTTTTTAKATTTTTRASTTRSSTTTRPYTTQPYTRSSNPGNTYAFPDTDLSTTEAETESATDLLALWETTNDFWMTMSPTVESTTELEENTARSPLSKSKIILIVLMAAFALIGVAIIISMVRKSKG